MTQKIVPCLWFDRQAEEAASFYASIFPNSRVGSVTRYTKAGFDVHHMPEGTVMTVEFEIARMRFTALNGGPVFKFNPSVSLLVTCSRKEEVDSLWEKLSKGGGPALMELGTYPMSERYGWLQDRYGLSWQIMYVEGQEFRQAITPTLMFTGKKSGRAEEAVNLYTTVFHDASIDHIMRYGKGEEPDEEGTVKHAGFTLEGQKFAAMDSARQHNFTFNEAVSLMVECQTQDEIDYYWERLTANGGQESVCGWLKDRFGLSWQVAPIVLNKMLQDPDKEKVVRVTDVFLKMKKINIGELEKAYGGTPQEVV